MTDPWTRAAEGVRHKQKEIVAQREREAANRRSMLAAEQAARETAQRELQAAIDHAVPLLEAFLEKRGAAAQELLGALGAFIVFGDGSEGGGYYSVYLSGGGLKHEIGTGSSYSRTATEIRPATPQEAVKAFAYDGEGRRDPNAVGIIVEWLTSHINNRIPR